MKKDIYRYNIILSLIFIALSIWMIVQSGGYGSAVDGTAMGAGAWPRILAVVMIVLSLVLMVRTMIEIILEKKNKKPRERSVAEALDGQPQSDGIVRTAQEADAVNMSNVIAGKPENSDGPAIPWRSEGMKRIYKLLGILIIFMILLYFLGFYIATAFLVPSVMYLMGERKIWKMAAVTGGILLFFFAVFFLLLNLKLPVGLIFK